MEGRPDCETEDVFICLSEKDEKIVEQFTYDGVSLSCRIEYFFPNLLGCKDLMRQIQWY